MFKDITLGQYYPSDSAIHKLDPRTKILTMIFYIVAVFLVNRIYAFIFPAIYVVSVMLIAKIPLRYIKNSIKPIKWIIIFMFILNLFLSTNVENPTVVFEWWILRITHESIYRSIYITLRLITLVAGTSLMTLTTTPISLTDGLERLLAPLKAIKFPVHELAMMMTIALRFIPTLLEEVDKITKAQLARGADFESGSIIKRAKSMIPILIPLFISAFRRADELAMAMESRCYHGGEGRTKMNVLKFHINDLYAILVMIGMCAVIVVIQMLLPIL